MTYSGIIYWLSLIAIGAPFFFKAFNWQDKDGLKETLRLRPLLVLVAGAAGLIYSGWPMSNEVTTYRGCQWAIVGLLLGRLCRLLLGKQKQESVPEESEEELEKEVDEIFYRARSGGNAHISPEE
jgi:hypothetical protein